jgi:hypothetical protein
MSTASVRLFAPGPVDGASVRALLALLEGASRCARLLGRLETEFPLNRATVLRTGVSEGQLRDLIARGLLGCRGRADFFLTLVGEQVLTGCSPSAAPAAASPGKPYWCARARVLCFGGRLLKEFRREAPNQFLLLDSFQELGWPGRIDDPLPPVPGLLPQERLEQTVKSLNRSLLSPALHFGLAAGRRAVRWSPGG